MTYTPTARALVTLLPCPLCGAAARLFDRLNASIVTCTSCKCSVRQSDLGMGDAPERWNTRAHPPATEREAPGGVVVPEGWTNKERVTEAMEGGVRFWAACSGCHETNEGHPTGRFNAALQCHVGLGCHECGGLGAVWQDYGTEEAFQRFCADDQPVANIGGDSPSEPHLIRRHGAFFRPKASGYCTNIAGAGIYSGEEARSYLHVEGLTIHPVSAYASEINLVLEGAERLRKALLAMPAEGGGP